MNNAPDITRAKRLFYSVQIVSSLFFATANWLFFWRLYLTNGQIGFVDASVFLIGMLAEIPSGAVADRLGRRRAMIIASLLMGIGYTMTGFALDGSMIFIGFAIYMIGNSLFSGADDALMYDYLKAHGAADDWENIARRKQIMRRIGSLSAVFIGGILFVWNVRLPSIVRGLTYLLMLIPLARMAFMDGAEKHHAEDKPESYIKHIIEGMRELLNSRMLPVLLIVFVIQGVALIMFVAGILRPLMLERSSLDIDYHAFYLTAVSLVTLPLLWRKVKNIHNSYGRAIFWSGCILLGFIMNLPSNNLILDLTGILLIHVGGTMLVPATSTLINATATSRHRSTALSTASLVESLPYVLLAPFIGVIVDKGLIDGVIYGVVTTMATAIVISATLHYRQRLNKY